MQIPGAYTRHEILTQPEAWAQTLAEIQPQIETLQEFYQRGRYEAVIFTGCGSTYYLSLAAASSLQELSGATARGLPASEIWLHPYSTGDLNCRTLLVAISRSGETTETLRACESFRAHAKGDVLTLSCYPNRPLSRLGKLNLVFPAGQEESVAQTRAFTTLHLATLALAALWAGRRDLIEEMARLPQVCRRLLADYHGLAKELGNDPGLDRFYFLGSGPRYGLASELSLKMKEMSLSHSEPFHFLEFRHGPQSMVTSSTLIVGLVSGADRTYEVTILDEMRSRGSRTLSLGEDWTDVVFASGVNEAARNVLYLPIGQLLAYEHALFRGQDPDRPHNLEAVIKLEGTGEDKRKEASHAT